MIFVERGEIMTKYDDMTPAARFFHDLAGEAYGERRKAVIEAYKDAVRDNTAERYRYADDANERSPIRCCVMAMLALQLDGTHTPMPDDADLISILPCLVDGEFNWDAFDNWLALDGGWEIFRDICLDWEPQWFLDFQIGRAHV